MSILSVDNISPIGSGTSVTINSAATLVLNNANSTGIITAQQIVSNVGTFLSDVSVAGDFQVPDVIKHQGDVNTKIRFPANDTVTIETDGVERFRVASDGKVSIVNDLDVDGHTNLDNVSIAGVCTATSFVGDGSSLTGLAPKVGITTNLSGTFTASAGSAATINTFGYGSGDLVVEYTIYIKNGSDFQTQKLLAMRDGTTIHSTQFAVMFSSSLLVQCDATISSGNILLRATPETGVSGSTTFKVKREVM